MTPFCVCILCTYVYIYIILRQCIRVYDIHIVFRIYTYLCICVRFTLKPYRLGVCTARRWHRVPNQNAGLLGVCVCVYRYTTDFYIYVHIDIKPCQVVTRRQVSETCLPSETRCVMYYKNIYLPRYGGMERAQPLL